ncbi:MAG TPA: VOC family protein [Chloroflexota bacterium]|nr:VOC family protein [Chloroflexota bacterium]
MAARIRHVAISSGNSGLLLEFYQSLFGMAPDRTQVVTDGYIGMNVNRRGGGRQAGIDHFGVEVDDVEAVMARSRAAFPAVHFLKRPANRPFASIGTHDPAGNVFDLSQAGMENRRGFYADGGDTWRPRHISHFELRAMDPALLAEFYGRVYDFQVSQDADGKFAVSDGRVTLVIAPWDIRDYAGTGIERPAIEHLGFAVESVEAFERDRDQLMEARPDLFPNSAKAETEGARRMEILARCNRGALQLCDPDGILIDVAEA